MRTVTYEDLADLVSKALTRAWSLGQIYWQQADSEYASEWKKSDETQAKFNQLVEETRAVALAAAPDHPATEYEFNEAECRAACSICPGTKATGGDLPCARKLAANRKAKSCDADDAARLDRMESALEQIQAWASAYPIEVFPEPNWAESAKVLKDAGLSLDAISAANMRHVITRVQEIADNAKRASKGGE